MMNRFSAMWLVLGVAVGYAVAAPSARAAQSPEGLPFAMDPGDNVRLHVERGAIADSVISIDCAVEEVAGRWVRCRSTDSSLESRRQQRWYNLKYVAQLTRQQK